MSKTVDASEILYRMGKYGEVYENSPEHDLFQHFMVLLDKTISVLPNTDRKYSNRIDAEVIESEYKLVDAIQARTGLTRTDGEYPFWIGMTMKFWRVELGMPATFEYTKDNDGNSYSGGMSTSPVVDFYVSDDRTHVVIQTMNTIYKFEREDGEANDEK